MKKHVLLLLALLLTLPILNTGGSSTDLHAQSPIRFGLKGGINFANVTDHDDAETRPGGTIGLFVGITPPLSPLGLETGIYYSQKGARSTLDTGVFGEDITATNKIDYVEIPVLARLDFLPLPVLSPHLLAGPYIGFNVNSEFDSGTDLLPDQDLSDQTKSTEYGLMFGAGSDFNFGLASFNLQARYSMGLQDVFDSADGRNSVISIVLGVAL